LFYNIINFLHVWKYTLISKKKIEHTLDNSTQLFNRIARVCILQFNNNLTHYKILLKALRNIIIIIILIKLIKMLKTQVRRFK